MLSRNLIWLLVLTFCGSHARGLAQSDPGAPRQTADGANGAISRDLVTAKTQTAIEDGLAWLAKRQEKDGSFWSGSQYKQEVAITSLAGMAFLSAGNLPNQGRYGAQVAAAVQFILKSARPDGLINDPTSSSYGPMYGHGFSTLFLAEVYGTTPKLAGGSGGESEIRRVLENAVNLIIVSQNDDGGWRYEPDSADADISVTVCQVMALRAARNAGLAVPTETIDRAVSYVKKCQNDDGGFTYKLVPREPSLFPRSAAGVVALQSAGIYKGPAIEDGLAFLMRHVPRSRFPVYLSHYYYGHYYAVQAMWQAGGSQWTRWYPAVRDVLLEQQQTDGSWSSTTVCDEYGTAMALIILQMPNGYLPIFQR